MKLSDFAERPGVEFTWGNGYTKWRFITSNNLEENVNERGWETDYEVPLNLALRDDLREVQEELKVERWSFSFLYEDGVSCTSTWNTYESAKQALADHRASDFRCSEIRRVEYIIK